MTPFQLFDSVKLREAIPLSDGGVAPEGTPGTVVEVLDDGEAYLVELFGEWVKPDAQGTFVSSDRDDPEAFMETLGVETIYPHQLRLVKPASETVGARVQLLSVADELSQELLEEVVDFAEFLRQKQQRQSARTAVS
ncbi:MAG TPA: hypothetical protein DEP84_01870 [Chloroflexi bacterium]|nr:hypothetical protein [Chloroflexota bacterium]